MCNVHHEERRMVILFDEGFVHPSVPERGKLFTLPEIIMVTWIPVDTMALWKIKYLPLQGWLCTSMSLISRIVRLYVLQRSKNHQNCFPT